MTDHGYYKPVTPFAKATASLTDKLCHAKRRWKKCKQCGAAGAVYADPKHGHSDCIYCDAPYKKPKHTERAKSAEAKQS